MGTYTPGQGVSISATFIITATGAPIAPGSVTLKVLNPAMRETVTTSGFTNPSTGVYSYGIVVYQPGTWSYRWISTVPYSAGEGSFQVEQTPFLVPP